jgi:hypothetical protein
MGARFPEGRVNVVPVPEANLITATHSFLHGLPNSGGRPFSHSGRESPLALITISTTDSALDAVDCSANKTMKGNAIVHLWLYLARGKPLALFIPVPFRASHIDTTSLSTCM